MDKEYHISVIMCPHPWDNPVNKYFWMITLNGGMQGHGWSETPDRAWQDAKDYYINCIIKHY